MSSPLLSKAGTLSAPAGRSVALGPAWVSAACEHRTTANTVSRKFAESDRADSLQAEGGCKARVGAGASSAYWTKIPLLVQTAGLRLDAARDRPITECRPSDPGHLLASIGRALS